MFAPCVGLEQKDKEYGFEVISIGSGMVDTSMQLAVRSKTSDEFAMADFFKQASEDGKLQEPSKVAEKIYAMLKLNQNLNILREREAKLAGNAPLELLN